MKLKKTIKRIVALSTGATMLGATVLGAMAADLSEYPSPMFIKDGKFDGLIVIGADGDTQDMLGAMDIISSLQAVAIAGSSATSATTTTIGDVYQFESSTNKLNIGERLASIKSKLSDTHLPIILADGTLSTSKGAKYNFEQELNVSTGEKLQFFADKDYENEKPVAGLKITRNKPVVDYTLEFSKNAKTAVDTNDDMTDFEDRQIEMLGEIFDIIGSDNSTSELEFMRGALKPTLEEGETATFTIDGKEYEVTALIIDDTNSKVKFKINGEVTDSMVKGDVYQLADGVNIGAREILPNEAGDVTQDMVEFYLGAKKIKLTDGNELNIDDEDISNVDVVVTTSTNSDKEELEKIQIKWVADDDLFLTEDGNDVIMPGLESLKLYMNNFYKGAEERTRFYGSSDDTFTINAPLNDYDIKLDILYDDDGDGDFDYVGGSSTKKVITSTCSAVNFTIDMDTDEYFVVTKIDGKSAETEVLQLSKVHDTNGVTVKNYDGEVIAENKRATKTFDAAGMTVTVNGFDQTNSNAGFSISSSDCENSTLVTAEGMQIVLPPNGFGNLSAGSTASFAFNITEEDKDETIAAGPGYFRVNATFNTDNEVHAKLAEKTNLSNEKTYSVDDTKVYVGRIKSQLASMVTEDKTADQYEVLVDYSGEQTYGDIFLGAKAFQVSTTSGSEGVAATKIEVGAAVLDTSLASYTNQNLIVVGGPAINRAAAALMGKTYPAYGADSGITENSGMVRLVEQADGTVALIIAGWEAGDTQRASRVIAEYDSYALSGEEVVVTGTSMTDISVGVPSVE